MSISEDGVWIPDDDLTEESAGIDIARLVVFVEYRKIKWPALLFKDAIAFASYARRDLQSQQRTELTKLIVEREVENDILRVALLLGCPGREFITIIAGRHLEFFNNLASVLDMTCNPRLFYDGDRFDYLLYLEFHRGVDEALETMSMGIDTFPSYLEKACKVTEMSPTGSSLRVHPSPVALIESTAGPTNTPGAASMPPSSDTKRNCEEKPKKNSAKKPRVAVESNTSHYLEVDQGTNTAPWAEYEKLKPMHIKNLYMKVGVTFGKNSTYFLPGEDPSNHTIIFEDMDDIGRYFIAHGIPNFEEVRSSGKLSGEEIEKLIMLVKYSNVPKGKGFPSFLPGIALLSSRQAADLIKKLGFKKVQDSAAWLSPPGSLLEVETKEFLCLEHIRHWCRRTQDILEESSPSNGRTRRMKKPIDSFEHVALHLWASCSKEPIPTFRQRGPETFSHLLPCPTCSSGTSSAASEQLNRETPTGVSLINPEAESHEQSHSNMEMQFEEGRVFEGRKGGRAEPSACPPDEVKSTGINNMDVNVNFSEVPAPSWFSSSPRASSSSTFATDDEEFEYQRDHAEN